MSAQLYNKQTTLWQVSKLCVSDNSKNLFREDDHSGVNPTENDYTEMWFAVPNSCYLHVQRVHLTLAGKLDFCLIFTK